MANFLKFYCLCLKDAWRGSIEKANVWAAIIGAIIIWVGLWAWGYQLKPPETFGEGGRRSVLNRLRHLYVTSHDEVSFEMNSGVIPLPKCPSGK